MEVKNTLDSFLRDNVRSFEYILREVNLLLKIENSIMHQSTFFILFVFLTIWNAPNKMSGLYKFEANGLILPFPL